MRLFCATLVLLFAHVVQLGAQTLTGRLVDDDSGRPIVAGTIDLLTTTDSLIAAAITDHDGFFRIPLPTDGPYRIRAKRTGYRTAVSGLPSMRPGDSVEVEFRLSTQTLLLEAVSVRRRYRWELTRPQGVWSLSQRSRLVDSG